jgi:hypothetical protein
MPVPLIARDVGDRGLIGAEDPDVCLTRQRPAVYFGAIVDSEVTQG